MSRPDIFYEPPKGQRSGLPHDPFKSFVIPRPIGWISTKSRDGKDNLAPFSQFTNVSFDPPTILFVADQSLYKKRSKDTVLNCAETNEFVWNMVSHAQAADMNATALETWEDEFTLVENGGIEKAACRVVRPPRVAASPVSLECRVHSIVRVANEHHGEAMYGGPHLVGNSDIVIGRVLGVHIRGEYITSEGLFDVLKAAPVARNGYNHYTHVSQVWAMQMPTMPGDSNAQRLLGGQFPEEAEGDDKKGKEKDKETEQSL